ncbi:MFS general substrate transporter [Penicillium sp. IBT 16267x]|nr:MFS general substrate transporter [Penicillium sp. IBT 16267x]
MSKIAGEEPERTGIPHWRLIFDAAVIPHEVAAHRHDGAGTDEDPFQMITLLVGINTLPSLCEELGIVGISLFVVGFAVGPLIWAPLSEMYGRRPILIASSAGLTAFTAGCTGAQNIWTLLILRFIAGSLGSAPFAVAGGVIADCFPPISRGLASGLYCAAPFLGPTLGPIIGGFLSESAGWRWVEGKLEIDQGKKSPAAIFKVALSRPRVLLFREPIVLLLSIYLAIIYGINADCLPNGTRLERRTRLGGLSFLGITVGILFSVVATFPTYFNYKNKTLAAGGRLPPEQRLPGAMIGSIALPAGLFCRCPPQIRHGDGLPPNPELLIDAFTIYAASVLAANAALRSIFGAVFPLFTPYMYENLGIHWASSLPAFLALACVPMPFLFYPYGPGIRKRCHYAATSHAFMEKLYEKTALPPKTERDEPVDAETASD